MLCILLFLLHRYQEALLAGSLLWFAFLKFFHPFLFILYGNLSVKRDELMHTSYLEAYLFGNRNPEWMANLPSNRGQDSNPSVPPARAVPLYHGGPYPLQEILSDTIYFIQVMVRLFFHRRGFLSLICKAVIRSFHGRIKENRMLMFSFMTDFFFFFFI